VSRPLRLTLIALGVLAFLAVSAAVARLQGASGAERHAAIEIVKAHAPAGRFSVLRFDGPGFAFGGRAGTARVVWRVDERLPVVQCVALRRSGGLLRGFRVRAVGLSAPIPRQAPCPGR
jgi:hypothetical protein